MVAGIHLARVECAVRLRCPGGEAGVGGVGRALVDGRTRGIQIEVVGEQRIADRAGARRRVRRFRADRVVEVEIALPLEEVPLRRDKDGIVERSRPLSQIEGVAGIVEGHRAVAHRQRTRVGVDVDRRAGADLGLKAVRRVVEDEEAVVQVGRRARQVEPAAKRGLRRAAGVRRRRAVAPDDAVGDGQRGPIRTEGSALRETAVARHRLVVLEQRAGHGDDGVGHPEAAALRRRGSAPG